MVQLNKYTVLKSGGVVKMNFDVSNLCTASREITASLLATKELRNASYLQPQNGGNDQTVTTYLLVEIWSWMHLKTTGNMFQIELMDVWRNVLNPTIEIGSGRVNSIADMTRDKRYGCPVILLQWNAIFDQYNWKSQENVCQIIHSSVH